VVPGSPRPPISGNRTAFDAVFLHTTPTGGRGFVGIETKYHERPARPGRLTQSGWRGMWRSLSAPVSCGRFGGRRWPRRAWSRSGWITCWPCRCWKSGATDSASCYIRPPSRRGGAASRYTTWLLDARTFEHSTLEELVTHLGQITSAPWVATFQDRYLEFEELASVRLHRERLRASKSGLTALRTSVSAGRLGP
jgi:hypothetical protein